MSTKYNIEHFVDSFYEKEFTNFLNPLEFRMVKNKLPKKIYKVLEVYENCSKVIIYKNNIPDIRLLKVFCTTEVRHQELLKGMFELGLKEDLYGDIVINDKVAYIYCLPQVIDYLIVNLASYCSKIIKMEEIPWQNLQDYKIKYQVIEIIVSSLRIDNVLATLLGLSRKMILEKVKNKEIILNYQIISKGNVILQVGDTFSVRKFGKYYFDEIKTFTKRGSLVIKVKKYI